MDKMVTGLLKNPIQVEETGKALQKLKNGKASGNDKIAAELIKYGGPPLAQAITDVLNDMFCTGTALDLIGVGVLVPLQKPGKPRGPLKSIPNCAASNKCNQHHLQDLQNWQNE